MSIPGVYIKQVHAEVETTRRFNPYAEDKTQEFFLCVNAILDRYVGDPINKETIYHMERQLWLLISHLEMSGLMAPRMVVKEDWAGDHGEGILTIEILDRELLPIRPREPGYVPQVI